MQYIATIVDKLKCNVFQAARKKSIGKELLVYKDAKLWKNVDSLIKSLSWHSFKKRF